MGAVAVARTTILIMPTLVRTTTTASVVTTMATSVMASAVVSTSTATFPALGESRRGNSQEYNTCGYC